MELEFDEKKGIWTKDPASLEKLHRNWFGELEKGKGRIWLEPEEALYTIAFQKADCFKGKKRIGFNELAGFYMKKVSRLFVR